MQWLSCPLLLLPVNACIDALLLLLLLSLCAQAQEQQQSGMHAGWQTTPHHPGPDWHVWMQLKEALEQRSSSLALLPDFATTASLTEWLHKLNSMLICNFKDVLNGNILSLEARYASEPAGIMVQAGLNGAAQHFMKRVRHVQHMQCSLGPMQTRCSCLCRPAVSVHIKICLAAGQGGGRHSRDHAATRSREGSPLRDQPAHRHFLHGPPGDSKCCVPQA